MAGKYRTLSEASAVIQRLEAKVAENEQGRAALLRRNQALRDEFFLNGGGALAIDVRTFGAKGDGVTDDTAAIQAAIDGAPADSELFFPLGIYLISRPLNYTNRVRLAGTSRRGSTLRCVASGWSGSEILRNWTDADWAAGNDGNRPNTTANPQYYPQIEFLRFETNGNEDITCLSWVHMQESGYMQHLSFSSAASGTVAIGLWANSDVQGSHNGGELSHIVCYGSNWKRELHVQASGSDLHVSEWTAAPTLHSDSPFYLHTVIDITMDNMHVEATLDGTAPADAAIFEVTNCKGFSLRDSFYSWTVALPRPFVAARNTGGSGNGRTSPALSSVKFHSEGGTGTFSGNFLLDTMQSGLSRTIVLADPVHVNYYDGIGFSYARDSGSAYRRTVFTDAVEKTTATGGGGNIHNYAPGNASILEVLKDNTTAGLSISGFSLSQVDGRQLLVVAVHAAGTTTLRHENTGSLEENRIVCPGATDLTLTRGQAATLRYDSVEQRWFVISSS